MPWASVMVTPAGSVPPGKTTVSTYDASEPAGAPVLSAVGPIPLVL